MRRIFIILIIIFVLMHSYYAITGDFRSSHLLTAEETGESQKIVEQKYRFIGHGHQTYAFIGEDKTQVLKLFKKDYLLRSLWSKSLPPIYPFRSLVIHQGESKEYRKNRLLNGYRVAFKHDRQNSGLLAYHEKKGSEPMSVTLVDGLGLKHQVDLNDYVFAIQLPVKTTRDELSELLSQGNIEAAKVRLHQIIDLYLSSYASGIYDEDHNFIDNTGFIKDRAVRQDVGKVVWDPNKIDQAFIQADLNKVIKKRLAPWLKREYPAYADELFRHVKQYIETHKLIYSES